ncbi:ribonuclease H-like domain-containing protein [Microbacterium elymi]|uniref:ribonuclease H-like domain-containing protein n=1 Tax=Microbacterium elymi TaxID=2909587 RepID=UPI00338DA914
MRDGVFVDLYPIVRRALRVGSRSYSIKKLEPLYMGDEVRTSDVQRGDDSIVKYVQARGLSDDGQDAAAQVVLDDLADYNRYDCVSTRRLRDWLVDRAREADLLPSRDIESVEIAYAPSRRADDLRRLAADEGVPEADAGALRLGAAAIDYYPREAKSFWQAHFLRLREPITVWENTRDVVVVDADRSGVTEDWHPGPRSVRRLVRLARRGRPRHPAERGDAAVRAVRDAPAVRCRRDAAMGARGARGRGGRGARRRRDRRRDGSGRADVARTSGRDLPGLRRRGRAISRSRSTSGRMPSSTPLRPSRPIRPATSCAAVRRAPAPCRWVTRRVPPTTSAPSRRRCSTWIAATSPCRGPRAPARRMWARM